MDWALFWAIFLQVVIASITLRFLAGTWGYRRNRRNSKGDSYTIYNSESDR